MSFNYQVISLPGQATITLSGRLLEKSEGLGLIEEVTELLEGDVRSLTLDMAELEYLTSSGLNVLINLLTLTRNKGGELNVVNVNDRIRKLLLMTKLTTLFNVAPSPEETQIG